MAFQKVSGPKNSVFSGSRHAIQKSDRKIRNKTAPKRQGRQKPSFPGEKRHTEKCTQSKTVAKTIGSKHEKPRKSQAKLDFLPNPPARTSFRGFSKNSFPKKRTALLPSCQTKTKDMGVVRERISVKFQDGSTSARVMQSNSVAGLEGQKKTQKKNWGGKKKRACESGACEGAERNAPSPNKRP